MSGHVKTLQVRMDVVDNMRMSAGNANETLDKGKTANHPINSVVQKRYV